MATITEHTPDLEIEQDSDKNEKTSSATYVWWMFRTPTGVSEDDIRAALELVGGDFNADRDQVAVTDAYADHYGGMTSGDGNGAVSSLYKALDYDAEYRRSHPECRSFADLSRTERQDFMENAVECYSFVAEGNFNDTDPQVLAGLLAILTGNHEE